MRVIDKQGRVRGINDKLARALIKMGRVKPYQEQDETPKQEIGDDKDALIAELATYGIQRNKRYGVERLQSELEEARKKYSTRHMTAT